MALTVQLVHQACRTPAGFNQSQHVFVFKSLYKSAPYAELTQQFPQIMKVDIILQHGNFTIFKIQQRINAGSSADINPAPVRINIFISIIKNFFSLFRVGNHTQQVDFSFFKACETPGKWIKNIFDIPLFLCGDIRQNIDKKSLNSALPVDGTQWRILICTDPDCRACFGGGRAEGRHHDGQKQY